MKVFVGLPIAGVQTLFVNPRHVSMVRPDLREPDKKCLLSIVGDGEGGEFTIMLSAEECATRVDAAL